MDKIVSDAEAIAVTLENLNKDTLQTKNELRRRLRNEQASIVGKVVARNSRADLAASVEKAIDAKIAEATVLLPSIISQAEACQAFLRSAQKGAPADNYQLRRIRQLKSELRIKGEQRESTDHIVNHMWQRFDPTSSNF